MTTPLWTNNISILYEKKYLFEVLPDKHFDFNRKLNSLLRLSIYYSVIVFIMDRKKTNIFYIPFVVGILTHILSIKFKEAFTNQQKLELINDDKKEDVVVQEVNQSCSPPSKSNPFMNPLITENKGTESCDSYNSKAIQREIDNTFNTSLYRDVNDIFGKSNSQRQYYTIPTHDQGSFANWLYSTPKTCKEGNGMQCAESIWRISWSRK